MVTEEGIRQERVNEGGGKGVSPPYISYLTFKNCIEWLEQEGVPLRFDRSFWSKKYSGSVGPQLLNGLRFLNLLKGEEPQPDLEKLVNLKGEDRKEFLRKLYERSYSTVNFGELNRATPGMLRKWITEYPIDGDTVRKAESFFVNALKDADCPISNSLRKMARNRPARSSSPPKERRPRQPKGVPTQGQGAPPDSQGTSSAVVDAVRPSDQAMAQESLMLWGLFKRLPKPGEVFPEEEREAWIRAAQTVFDLEYKKRPLAGT